MAEHADLPLQRYMPWALIRRRVAAFVVIAALVITPLKLAGYFETVGEVRGVVLGESETAIGHLQAALTSGQALAFTDAAQDFGSAAAAFADAREGLAAYAGAINVAEWVPLQQTKSAKAVERLLRSGEAAATGASHLSLAIDALELVDPEGEGAAVPAPLTERIKEFRREAMAAQQAMQMLRQEITALDPEVVAGLPAPQAAAVAEQVALMRHNADLLTEGLDEVVAVAAFFEEFLGDARDTRYLLVFQNNAEMRASGGFIGSFALADFRQGTLKNLEVPAGGSYDLQGGLHTRVSAPEPLHLINSLWEFQDANWWPDWPTSAKKLEWFFVNGWGSSVDGVIAVTPDVIEDVLRVIGPVDMTADYGVTVTAENFYEVAQSRENLADANEPKAIIRDLTAAIIEEFPARLSWEKLVALAGVVHENLNGKQVLMAFDDPDLQAFADERNWSGRVAEAPRDYLMVVNTNIAGAKSDRAVRQHIKHEAAVTPDGGITVTVTVTRKHTAERGAAFSGVRNVDYMRLYVPKGSQLVSAHGFLAPEAIYFDEPAPGATADPDLAAEAEADIDEASGVRVYSEAGKTVFGHWSQVDPGEEVEIVLTYKLPFKLNEFTQEPNAWERIIGQRDVSDYSLLLQKQAGDTNTTYESSLKLSGGREVVWPKPAAADGMFVDGWQLQGELDRDRYWGIVIEKK